MGATVLLLAFAFGWTSCIWPVSGAVLKISANSGSLHDMVCLLVIYSTGLVLPFLLAALFTDARAGCFDSWLAA